jgi:hypothetical protein
MEKINGFTIAEIDAATCYITFAGAASWTACPEALDYWEKTLNRKKIEVTAENLSSFNTGAKKHLKENGYWMKDICIDCWDPINSDLCEEAGWWVWA